MKRSRFSGLSGIFLVLLLYVPVLSLCLSSCSTDTTLICEEGGSDSCVLDGTLYTFDYTGSVLTYADSSTEGTFVPLCSDPLCLHDYRTCPAYFEGVEHCIVPDARATKQNGGHPVLYVSCTIQTADGTQSNGIIRYDGKTNTRKTVLENIPDTLRALWLYGDKLLLSTNGRGEDLHVCDTKTGTLYTLPNEENKRFFLGGADADYIYYTDDAGGIYRSPHDLSHSEFLRQGGPLSRVYVTEDSLLFCDDKKIEASYDGLNLWSCSVYAVPKDNPTAEPVLFLENLRAEGSPMLWLRGDTVLYCQCKDLTYEETEHPVTKETVCRLSDGSDTLYLYDLRTQKTRCLYENSDYGMGPVCGMSDAYIAYHGAPMEWISKAGSGASSPWILYDYKNDIRTIIE